MTKDPYQILGVSRTASEDEIKQAYRRLAKQYHPDLHPGDASAAQKMNEINEAYDAVKNPQAYNQYQQQQRQQQAYSQQYTQHTTYADDEYDPFAAFWGAQNQNRSQNQNGQQYYRYTYRWNEQQSNQDRQNQYQWNYRRSRRPGLLTRLLLVWIAIQLLASLFGSCSYRYMNPYDVYRYYGYSESGEAQQEPNNYGWGSGSTQQRTQES